MCVRKSKIFFHFVQVSSSCSSVYVDGSEIRGSSNASVLVKYGTYTGLARFTVWMPEFPLEVSVTDTRLNQIKGWKVPEEHTLAKNKRSLNITDKQQQQEKPKKRSAANEPVDKEEELDYEEGEDDEEDEEDGEELGEGKMRFRSGDKWDEINSIDRTSSSASCKLRFQQSPVEVRELRLFFNSHMAKAFSDKFIAFYYNVMTNSIFNSGTRPISRSRPRFRARIVFRESSDLATRD